MIEKRAHFTEVSMLRQLLVSSALGAAAVALSLPARASEISGPVAVSGSMYYTADGGYMNFMTAAASSAPQSLAAFAPASSAADDLTLTNDFVYGGNITPAVFAATIGGQTGTLTLDSLNFVSNVADGMEVVLSGTFDQSGYAQELATASFLINSQYIGDDINLMMFRGIAQLTPSAAAVTPEPESVMLLGTGMLTLAGAGIVRRRKMARNAARVSIA